MIQKVYLINGSRTPIGSFLGSLKDISAIDLAISSTKHTILKTKINPKMIDQVIFGNVVSGGLGQNPCRQICLKSGVNLEASCVNVNKLCASGLKAVILGAQALSLGDGEIALVGGFESMSNSPFLLTNYRKGKKFGHFKIRDTLTCDALTDPYNKKAMGFCGEHTAKEMKITRMEQDEYCIKSYQRAILAEKNGVFAQEICPITTRKGILIDRDDEPKRFNPEKTRKLKPVFVDKYFFNY